MKLAIWFTLFVCFLFGIPLVAQAKEWHGIVPLHSTRADVHQLLDTAKKWDEDSYAATYEIEGDSIAIFYSRGPCEKGLPGGWNVPANTVVKIFINLSERTKILVADLLTDKRPYTQKVLKQNVLTESGVPIRRKFITLTKKKGSSTGATTAKSTLSFTLPRQKSGNSPAAIINTRLRFRPELSRMTRQES